MFKVFKSYIRSCKYLMPNGKEIIFVGGDYATDNEEEIKQLEAEVTGGHPLIYIDPNEPQRLAKSVDVLEDIRAKAVADYIAQTKGSMAMNAGETEAKATINPASTATVKPVTK